MKKTLQSIYGDPITYPHFTRAGRELAACLHLNEDSLEVIAPFLLQFAVRAGREVANHLAFGQHFTAEQILQFLTDSDAPYDIQRYFEDTEDDPFEGSNNDGE